MFVADLNDIKEPSTYTVSCDENKPQRVSTITWISVNEYLPTVKRACWVRTKDGVPPAMFSYNLRDKCFEIIAPCEIRFTTDYVTHWAPI